MSETDILRRADQLANEITPGVALVKFCILLENAFLGFFALIGWLLGRVWFHGSRMLYIVGLAFIDGYQKGAKVPPKIPGQANAPSPMPPVPAPAPVPGPAPSAVDDRIMDVYATPFGVPYGPNVFASHDLSDPVPLT